MTVPARDRAEISLSVSPPPHSRAGIPLQDAPWLLLCPAGEGRGRTCVRDSGSLGYVISPNTRPPRRTIVLV